MTADEVKGLRVDVVDLRLVDRFDPELVLVPLLLGPVLVLVGAEEDGRHVAPVTECPVLLGESPAITISECDDLLSAEVSSQGHVLDELSCCLGPSGEGVAVGFRDDLRREFGDLLGQRATHILQIAEFSLQFFCGCEFNLVFGILLLAGSVDDVLLDHLRV